MRALSDISNEELIKQIQGGINVKHNYEQLYKQNRGFIYMIVNKRAYSIHDIDDLMQDAYIALVKAVELYDETKEETSFLQLLKYYIWDGMRDKGQIPSHMNQKIIKYRRMYDKLYLDYGRKPTNDEISLHMGISLKELDTIKSAIKTQYIMSLDEPIGEEGTGTMLDVYAGQADQDIDIDDNLEKEELSNILHEAVDKLPEDRGDIINKKYFDNLTLVEIGKEKGISEEHVRRLEHNALRLLRQDHILRKKVEGYVDFYHPVSLNRFKNTHTSSVEWVVLERERRIEEWKGVSLLRR